MEKEDTGDGDASTRGRRNKHGKKDVKLHGCRLLHVAGDHGSILQNILLSLASKMLLVFQI